jgi:uncharacterized membrane protein YhiD involved in acid resistance
MDNVFVENLIKLSLAVLAGGIIGAEREYQDKAAGFRTIILITVGSALFTIFSIAQEKFLEMTIKNKAIKELDY